MLVTKKIKNRGKRVMTYVKGEQVDYKRKPHKPLTKMLKKRSGRMRSGRISIRSRGGGARRRYRLVSFGKVKGVLTIEAIERDPNRGAFIALVQDEKGKKYYWPATTEMKAGDKFEVGEKAEIKQGNRTTLARIISGSMISNIELVPGGGGKLARGAGTYATMMGVEGGMAQLKMPSGEIRLVSAKCEATIGQTSNPERSAVRIGKAGRMRLMGRRPRVRGTAMNPVDHPHGGGEGKQSIGLKHPKTPWGKPALGVRTRKGKLRSDKYIIKRRKK